MFDTGRLIGGFVCEEQTFCLATERNANRLLGTENQEIVHMWRLASLMVVGITVGAAEPAQAQRGPSSRGNENSNEFRQLQADLDKLKSVLKDLETKLEKAKEARSRRDDRRPQLAGRLSGLPVRGPGRGPMSRGSGAGGRSDFDRGPGGPGIGRGPGGAPGRARGGPGGSRPGAGSTSSVERRLEKIENDLEDLKRELRHRR